MKILICGVGSLGSNLAALLACDLKGEHEITVLDFDKVAERNLMGTQYYFPGQEEQLKSEALEYSIYKHFNREINIITEKLTTSNAVKILSNYNLIIDAFDNYESRSIVQSFHLNYGSGEVLHLGLSNQMTFEISWAENYQVPTDITSGFDICEMEGASSFVKLVASLGSLVIQQYLKNGSKREFVGSALTIREIK